MKNSAFRTSVLFAVILVVQVSSIASVKAATMNNLFFQQILADTIKNEKIDKAQTINADSTTKKRQKKTKKITSTNTTSAHEYILRPPKIKIFINTVDSVDFLWQDIDNKIVLSGKGSKSNNINVFIDNGIVLKNSDYYIVKGLKGEKATITVKINSTVVAKRQFAIKKSQPPSESIKGSGDKKE